MLAGKRVALIAAGVLGGAAVAMASWNGIDPDNPVANQIQMRLASSVPGEFRRITPEGPLNGRLAVVLVHGWTANGWMSDEELTHTFDRLLIDWRGTGPGTQGIFSGVLKVDFDKHFVVYEYHYDSSVAPDVNGRRLAQKIEGDPELTLAKVRIVPVGHSMGVLVSQGFRVVDDRKCVGLLGAGGPINGSPATDLSKVEAWAKKVGGKKAGELLASITKGINFTSDGTRWLSMNYLPRRKMFDAKPLDANCYLYAGEIKPVPMKIGPVVWNIATLADAAKLQGDDYQKQMILYPFAAAMIEGCGGGPNDGMVPVSSALATGCAGGAVLHKPIENNHSQMIREYDIHLQMARDLWEIYLRTQQAAPNLSSAESDLPDTDIASGLSGFGNKLDQPIQVWWQEGSQVKAWNPTLQTAVEINVNCSPEREVAVDSTGWKMAVPGQNGLSVIDFQTGRSTVLLSGQDVTATTWNQDQLVVVYRHELKLLDEEYRFKRLVVRDDGLDVTTRPVVIGSNIFVANNLPDGRYDIYRISLNAQQVKLTDTAVEEVAKGVSYRPRPAKSALVGVYQEDGATKVQWLSTGLLSLTNQPLRPIVDKLITKNVITSMADMAESADGSAIYLVVDGKIRSLNVPLAKTYLNEAIAKPAEALVHGESEAYVDWDKEELLPVIGVGDHLGAL